MTPAVREAARAEVAANAGPPTPEKTAAVSLLAPGVRAGAAEREAIKARYTALVQDAQKGGRPAA